jgi:DNA polymerase V
MYALVDCNSCYASCETIFRPELRGKPVIVLSNNDGVVVARNRPAKDLGIPDLAAFFKIEHMVRKHRVHVFSSNYELYADISSRVMQTLEQFAPDIEIYSIDEAFLPLASCREDAEIFGRRIRQTLWREVRMPVSVGVAPTRTLAKLANHVGKNRPAYRGVCVWQRAEDARPLLRDIPVGKVWGVGPRLSRHLDNLDILTAYDLSRQPPRRLRAQFSIALERTVRELNGEACLPLHATPSPKQQIFTTRTFGKRVKALGELQEAVSFYAGRACQKLRQQGSFTGQVLVFIQTSRFDPLYYHRQRVISLPYPSNDVRLVSRAVRDGVASLYQPGLAYYKAGVGLLELSDSSHRQLHLFEALQSDSALRLMATLDAVNGRFPDSLSLAASGIRKPWRMRRPRRSPSYTTRWQDLPVVS